MSVYYYLPVYVSAFQRGCDSVSQASVATILRCAVAKLYVMGIGSECRSDMKLLVLLEEATLILWTKLGNSCQQQVYRIVT